MNKYHFISVILPLKLEWTPCYKSHEPVAVGERVRVTFAGKEYIGAVCATEVKPEIAESRILEIINIERGLEIIRAEEIRLWQQVSEYYLCSIGEVYKAAYPQGKISLEESYSTALMKLAQRQQKLIESLDLKLDRLHERLKKKTESAEKAKEGTKARLTALSDIEKLKEEIALAQQAKNSLLSNDSSRSQESGSTSLKEAPELSAAQIDAYSQIKRGFQAGKPVLLHGVTGSGKTEIYIKLAQEAISDGKNILYLVPEIALSRQLEDRLYKHFGNRLVVFHSGESAVSRRNSAEKIRKSASGNEGYIALCTRSGLFLPHHDLGLIIVDEEHDSSYKQDSPAPRYNGRDTALMLSRIHDCSIILGSATPSLEEIYNTANQRHLLVSLNQKYHTSEDVDIEIVDTKAERRKRGMSGNFSRKLIDHINITISEGGQVLILRSRRAWATVMQCDGCGDILKCPHCNVSMSYHKATGKMLCHYCGHSSPYTGICNKCGGPLTGLGAGTQKIEEEAAMLFPDARIARLDGDTAQNKSKEAQTIRDFANGEIDILIGTQIITKGFDFEKLRLVAVISADSMLGVQDFRADEKALQLLEQFKGRCGRRGQKGLFVIQTSQPEHPIYQNMLKNDSDASSLNLLMERKDFEFPPYTRIIEITVKDIYEDRADRMSGRLAQRLGRFNISGPYSPVISKIADHHIRKIRISLKKDRNLRKEKITFREIVRAFEKDNRYDNHIIIDVDPS